MDKYIGFKMVEAEPMDQKTFTEEVKCQKYNSEISALGYKVTYPDGYVSWSPKEVFEKAYMQIGDNNTITQDNVSNFVKDLEYKQFGDKTTVAKATLKNGFEIIESSSCVDPANFNMEIGMNICNERIRNKVWELLGFLLQTAKNGIK
jgi:hypothetical protein